MKDPNAVATRRKEEMRFTSIFLLQSLLLSSLSLSINAVDTTVSTTTSSSSSSLSTSTPNLLRKPAFSSSQSQLHNRHLVQDAVEEQLNSATLPQHDDDDDNNNNGDTLIPRPRIINGEDVTDPDRYPWFVHIRGSTPDGLPELKACGGSLIAPDLVLSAAHCE
jgi:V8-like Glu-specific endopeptidase